MRGACFFCIIATISFMANGRKSFAAELQLRREKCELDSSGSRGWLRPRRAERSIASPSSYWRRFRSPPCASIYSGGSRRQGC